MRRKGDCWDNARMESFFHTLKTEIVNHRRCPTRWEAKADIFEYIEDEIRAGINPAPAKSKIKIGFFFVGAGFIPARVINCYQSPAEYEISKLAA